MQGVLALAYFVLICARACVGAIEYYWQPMPQTSLLPHTTCPCDYRAVLGARSLDILYKSRFALCWLLRVGMWCQAAWTPSYICTIWERATQTQTEKETQTQTQTQPHGGAKEGVEVLHAHGASPGE